MFTSLLCLIAFAAALLTFFSGFGLGTILLPAFALYFPIDISIGMTAIVHLLNNLFKLMLLGKHADVSIIKKFGIPSLVAAILGAFTLHKLGTLKPLVTYTFWNHDIDITPLKMTIGIVLIFFAIYELIPSLYEKKFNEKYLPVGGLLSGFFGGLSGHQGALRSAFLSKLPLSKESFIATGVVIACLIDVSRLSVYVSNLSTTYISQNSILIFVVTMSAFVGSYLGSKWLKKITIEVLQKFVSIALILFGLAMFCGVV